MYSRASQIERAALQRAIRKEAARYRSWWRRMNWHLLLGGITVLFVLVIAIIGPALAPQDPMERHTIVQVGESWEVPPFPAFTVPGFLLGSDSYGRDLLSRLLYAVYPTMRMVAIVAGVRLVLGTAIGLVAGWFSGRVGRFLDTAIAGALSVPILMVALIAIAAVGAEVGLPAFIVGLSITGWAETARIVREQTRGVKGNLYIEASRALGQSHFQILIRHVLRQIMPMVWMLLALEISATLMTTAGLGFLGYYIGGDVWIEVADFQAGRLSGMPELGQMLALATSRTGIVTLAAEGMPWALVSLGTTIFVIVLGFNLLGEGLRVRLSPDRVGRETAFTATARSLGWWIEERMGRRVARWPIGKAIRIAGTVLLVVVVGGGLLWWRLQATATPEGPLGQPRPALTFPGGHLWPMERHDSYGTRYVEVERLLAPEILWVFEDRSGLAGGPAVAADGTVYLVSKGKAFYALSPDGQIIWQASLPADGAGAPALNAEGDIYGPDKEGGLSCFTSGGDLRWRFVPENPGVPVAGAAVASDGTIFYPIGSRVEAVSPDGRALWEATAPHAYRLAPVQVSPDGELLFWEDVVLNAEDGSLVDLDLPVAPNRYVVGVDGWTYFLSEHTLSAWQMGPAGAEVVQSAAWDSAALAQFQPPTEAGVTPEGVIWLYYGGYAMRIVWLDTGGRVLGIARPNTSRSPPIAVDADATVYFCAVAEGFGPATGVDCLAYSPGSEEPLWHLPLENEGLLNGGALVPGRLYVTQSSGFLYAIGDKR